MRLLAAAILLTSATAAADPCAVTFVRVPDDVRTEIERWLSTEPRCATPLELRIVPTDGGLYVWAQRPDGQVHERVVPDAQTAGVLVASWAADDAVDRSTPAPAARALVAAPPAMERTDAPPAIPPQQGGGEWVSFGLMFWRPGDVGWRGSVDLVARGPWRFGVTGSYSSGHPTMLHASGQNWIDPYRDAKLVATVSRGVTWHGWELGASLGVGALHTEFQLSTAHGMPGFDTATKTSVVAEASALVTRQVIGPVSLAVGPVLTFIDQSVGSVDGKLVRREITRSWVLSLRYAL